MQVCNIIYITYHVMDVLIHCGIHLDMFCIILKHHCKTKHCKDSERGLPGEDATA